MAEEPKSPKLEGKATAKLTHTTPQQLWPLLEDFCNFHKWLPTLDTCHHVQGLHGQPGLIRYCATVIQPSSTDGAVQAPTVKWCHEKLLAIDPVQRFLRYEIGENNLGFTSYVSEMKVVESGGGGGGCMVEWSFTADPVEGLRSEDLCGYIQSALEGMVERMEKELQAQAATN
ncbi:hypothetical protein SSX86_012495 [Deinandra increscens subsp. villosa]|uniref:Lachrymatory factor synthase n=1 Tax=Deinandra increscens subsp. villosa TaxID=3103831 RepID=A0AAP0H1K7_9ASTR